MVTNNKKTDERLSLLLSAIDKGNTSVEQQFLKELRERSADEFQACSAEGGIESQVSTVSFWRMIMRSRVSKVSAAAAIIIAALIGIGYLAVPLDGSSAVFAKTIEALKTIPWMHAKVKETEHDMASDIATFRKPVMKVGHLSILTAILEFQVMALSIFMAIVRGDS